MDNRVYKLLNWENNDDKEELALIDIKDHSDRKFFWNYWHTNKEHLKANGFSMFKGDDKNFYMKHVLKEEVERIKKEKEKTKKLSRAVNARIKVPAPEGLDYFPYQKAAIKFAKTRPSTLIGDEMGTGKTVTTAGIINYDSKIKKVLVICPASLRINWKRELDKWLVKNYKVGVVNRSEYPNGSDIIVINYDVVPKHHETLSSIEWDLLVIDEAHYLKNRNAKRTKYILGHEKSGISGIKSKKKVFLTGTPILNRPIEMFPILNALDSETWSSQWKFAKRYCDAKHNGFGWDFSGSSNLDELQDELRSSIMIRRTKKEVLPELPGKFRQVIELPYNNKIKKLLDQEKSEWDNKEELLNELKASSLVARISDNRDDYKESVESLKQGVAASFGDMAKLREKIALLKVPYVIEHLKDIDSKVVVFAHHKSVVNALYEELGDEAVVLVGDTKMEDRQDAVDRFQNDPKVKYFIGSIMAAGVGITLTSSSHVVFAELDWVPGVINQCEDRCARIGQKNNVLVQHLVLEESLDAKIAKTLTKKQEVIDKALDLEYSLSEPVTPEEKEVEYKDVHSFKGSFSQEDKNELLNKLRFLANFDEDGARQMNNVGFNKIDSHIGKSLASQLFLSDKQAYVAEKILKKYKGQLERLGYG